jgi:hypothetical protein
LHTHLEISMSRLSRARSLAFVLGAFACASLPDTGLAQSAADRDAVKRAALDYVEGFYEGDSTKLARGIRPEVYKYGFWRPADKTTYSGSRMSYDDMFAYARRVRENNRQAPASAPKEVVIYEVLDQTATAKLTASWGTDYLLLGKYDGRWMISHVIWQSPPPNATAAKE